MNKLLKLDPSNTTLLAQKHNLLQKEIEETNNKLKVLKEANKKAGEIVKNYDAWEKADEPIRQEMEKTKTSISELKKKMNVLHVFRICKIPDGTDTIAPSGNCLLFF